MKSNIMKCPRLSRAGLILLGLIYPLLCPAQTQSYTLLLAPGYNLIANQLDHGSNTADILFPNQNARACLPWPAPREVGSLKQQVKRKALQ
jgi:hypothetical protein